MEKDSKVIRELLDGSLLTKKAVVEQLPYIFFLIVLTFLYIANRYHAEHLAMETARLQKEIRDLRSESISIASEYMYLTKQAEIQTLVDAKQMGLRMSDQIPGKVEVEIENE